MGWIDRNPATPASPPSVHHRRTITPSPADWQRLVDACDDDPELATTLRLAAPTAPGEVLCALRWSDVDLETGLVWIGRSVVVGENLELVEKAAKTHVERRFTPDAGTVGGLRAHQRRMEDRAGTCATYAHAVDPETSSLPS